MVLFYRQIVLIIFEEISRLLFLNFSYKIQIFETILTRIGRNCRKFNRNYTNFGINILIRRNTFRLIIQKLLKYRMDLNPSNLSLFHRLNRQMNPYFNIKNTIKFLNSIIINVNTSTIFLCLQNLDFRYTISFIPVHPFT